MVVWLLEVEDEEESEVEIVCWLDEVELLDTVVESVAVVVDELAEVLLTVDEC